MELGHSQPFEVCEICGRELPWIDFPADEEGNIVLKCNQCLELAPNDPNRAYRSITPNMIFQLLDAECNNCGSKDYSRMQVDHIVPKSLGGSNSVNNIQILCSTCHREKTTEEAKRRNQ
jgi:5-methylcytosine-specific restriction endonuclease McrA